SLGDGATGRRGDGAKKPDLSRGPVSSRLVPSRPIAPSPDRPVAPSRPQGAPPGQQSPARATGYPRGVPRGAAPAPPPAGRGTVEADAAAFGLTLLGSGPLVTIESQNGRAPVAADRYDVLNWWAERRDAEGRLWRARGGRRPDGLTIAPGTT